MGLPSSRELELETLLRQRDSQLSELTDELAHLRRATLSQPGASSTEPVTLPPALVSVLSPHLQVSQTASGMTAGSNTVNAALIQRARTLQEENDELYDLLKSGETGKLKEEVRGLRRVVARLESALRESDQVITTLSTELDKSYNTLLASARPSTSANNSTKSISQSPRAPYYPISPIDPSSNLSMTNGPSKLPPTGPRAYKKPRLSDAPPQRTNAPPSTQHKPHGRPTHGSTRDYAPSARRGRGTNSYHKMDVDEDQRARPPSTEREREYERDRERERERGRNRDRERGGRDRERDGHGRHRRNGGGGGGRNTFSGGRGLRTGHDHTQASPSANDSMHSGDRTLRERMGL
ncbi:hypothetical protein C0992_007792 [Termitomyces sp. T32_za158]|nr:hypothetical protein C0992_007792 [Termitomyces sp. T32_za158]